MQTLKTLHSLQLFPREQNLKFSQMISYCVDEITNLSCILDPGSSVSIFPNIYQLSNNSPVSLYNSANHLKIPILGNINRDIKIGTNYYSWTFFIADIHYIILGQDFISKFSF